MSTLDWPVKTSRRSTKCKWRRDKREYKSTFSVQEKLPFLKHVEKVEKKE